MTGNLPMNSGIIPNVLRSSCDIYSNGSNVSLEISIFFSTEYPIFFMLSLPLMISSRPENAPVAIKRIFFVLT